MKKLLTLIAILCNVTICFAQGAALTKEETVNYINKKLGEVLNLKMDNYPFNVRKTNRGNNDDYWKVNSVYITDNHLSYENSDILIHTDQIANTLNKCYQVGEDIYGSKRTTIHFNPRHVTKIEVVSDNEEKIGTLRIDFIPNTVKWDNHKYEFNIMTQRDVKEYTGMKDFFGNPIYRDAYAWDYKCDNTYKSTNTPKGDAVFIYFLKSEPSNANKLVKAFNHLIDLHKAEDDPFGD